VANTLKTMPAGMSHVTHDGDLPTAAAWAEAVGNLNVLVVLLHDASDANVAHNYALTWAALGAALASHHPVVVFCPWLGSGPREQPLRSLHPLLFHHQVSIKTTLTEVYDCVREHWPRHVDVCSRLAQQGDLAGLQWLHQRGWPWNDEVCNHAARSNRLDILQWVRAQMPPAPWSVWTSALAAQQGHFELLQWLTQHGCPWDEVVCEQAAENHWEILVWLRSQTPPCPWDLEEICFQTIEHGHLDRLPWLGTQHTQWENVDYCSAAAECAQWPILQWLMTHDCPWDAQRIKECAIEGDHPPQFYGACRWLQSTVRRLTWSDGLSQWLDTVEDLADEIWPYVLGTADLIALVKKYA